MGFSGEGNYEGRWGGYIWVVCLLSDSTKCLQKFEGTGDTVRNKFKPLMSLSRGCVSVWLLTPTEGEQTGSSSGRAYELFGSLLTSMDNGGKNGNKFAERSSPTPFTMVGVNAIRDRTALLEMFQNWGRNFSDPMAWLSQFLMEFDMGSKERCSSTSADVPKAMPRT